jgi:hypothetical protein
MFQRDLAYEAWLDEQMSLWEDPLPQPEDLNIKEERRKI